LPFDSKLLFNHIYINIVDTTEGNKLNI